MPLSLREERESTWCRLLRVCHCHRTAAASLAASSRLSLRDCNSVWGEGTGRGTHIRLLARLQIPCHRAGYQFHRAVWGTRRQAWGLTMSAARSPLILFISRGDLPLGNYPYLPHPQRHAQSSRYPPLWTVRSEPRNAKLLASREGRQRQQTVAANILGVILAWLVLGQIAGLKGLLARLSRILFILRPQLPGKQQVIAQKHCSRIEGCQMKGSPFL